MMILGNILAFPLRQKSHFAFFLTIHSLRLLLTVVELQGAAVVGLRVRVGMRQGRGGALERRVGGILTEQFLCSGRTGLMQSLPKMQILLLFVFMGEEFAQFEEVVLLGG